MCRNIFLNTNLKKKHKKVDLREISQSSQKLEMTFVYFLESLRERGRKDQDTWFLACLLLLSLSREPMMIAYILKAYFFFKHKKKYSIAKSLLWASGDHTSRIHLKQKHLLHTKPQQQEQQKFAISATSHDTKSFHCVPIGINDLITETSPEDHSVRFIMTTSFMCI